MPHIFFVLLFAEIAAGLTVAGLVWVCRATSVRAVALAVGVVSLLAECGLLLTDGGWSPVARLLSFVGLVCLVPLVFASRFSRVD